MDESPEQLRARIWRLLQDAEADPEAGPVQLLGVYYCPLDGRLFTADRDKMAAMLRAAREGTLRLR